MNSNSLARKNLSLDRLLNFAAVVRKGGISAASGGDLSRQALFSRQISELAAHFGVELTRSSGRGMIFTPAGAQLARLVAELETGLDELRAGIREAPLVYSIAGSNSALQWLFLPKLKSITEALPSVKWALHHEANDAIGEKVMMGQIDFGLCIGPPSGASLRRRFLDTMEYSLFASALLGGGDAVALLREAPLALPVGGTLRASLDVWAKKTRTVLNVRLDVDSYLQAADAVVRGTHAAVLPSLAATSMPKQVRSLPLPPAVAQRRKLWLVWTDRLLRTRSASTGVRNQLIDVLSG